MVTSTPTANTIDKSIPNPFQHIIDTRQIEPILSIVKWAASSVGRATDF